MGDWGDMGMFMDLDLNLGTFYCIMTGHSAFKDLEALKTPPSN
jgi:hypothetical protein